MYVTVSNSPVTGNNDRVFFAPFANIYEDCHVCCSDQMVSIMNRNTDFLKDKNAQADCIRAFWNSRFEISKISSCSIWTGEHVLKSTSLNNITQWAKLSSKNPLEFVTKTNWPISLMLKSLGRDSSCSLRWEIKKTPSLFFRNNVIRLSVPS